MKVLKVKTNIPWYLRLLPNLTEDKRALLLQYAQLLREVNQRVNLLSRKDMDDVEYRHVAFCAAISAFFNPAPNAKIADVGSGGGLPGIVMAILYPQAQVSMFDGVGKKIAMIKSLLQKTEYLIFIRFTRMNLLKCMISLERVK